MPVAAEPCKSGPQPSQRPGPYSSLVGVGQERGQQHCYICEAAERPIVIVFARNLSEPLGKLVHRIDARARRPQDRRAARLGDVPGGRSDELDPKVVAWGKKHAIRNVPLGIFEDTVGPPTYLLARDADVTVLLVGQASGRRQLRVPRRGELNDAAIE